MLTAETLRVPASVSASPPNKPLGWKQIVEAVDPFLQSVARRLAAQTAEFDPQIATYAQYALTAQGKQLRPILVSLSGDAAGSLNDSHITVATIIEMVHLATLVHDDVIDEADLRRGRPSLAANWGNEVSVLLGDCLFAHALKLAASFPTPEICRAVASSTNIVCAGEILQTRSRGDFEVSRAHYFKILGMKTAELFALSCDLGACLGGASVSRREALRQYGVALGTAYQLYDDCLDVLGSEAAAGKTLGADLAGGKVTLPILIVRERADAADWARMRQWIQQWEPARLEDVLAMIAKYEALHESRAVIQTYLEAARAALAGLPKTNASASLAALTSFLAEQTEALGVVY
ncbi:MAG TPA: polyprenyl synthetase family protein [Verrucomicrobiae bacterium]|jgi:octaprenyl-diphosphate synthase|nr:polyprenyl synthetase family protein [Verrucomicrobiae bacterium]